MLALRRRALLGGVASGLISAAVGIATLYGYVDDIVQDRFDSTLRDRHSQIVVALNLVTDAPEQLGDLMFDPAYSTPFSGRYWQVTSDSGDIYTSDSMFDQVLQEPTDAKAGARLWDSSGPEGEGLRTVYQKITFEDGTRWGVSVSETLTQLSKERASMRQSVFLVFSLVGVIGMAGSVLLTSIVLLPLRKLRRDVAQRWDREEALAVDEYPEEVAPLVGDINELLKRNRDIVAGARRQAADLAHALKTPSAILRNELASLSETSADTNSAVEALDRIDAQLGRSLARMRASNSAELTHSRADLHSSVARFSRLFCNLAERAGKSFTAENTQDIRVRMDIQDIEEVIGNLLDNALKFSRSKIQLTTAQAHQSITIIVEDDGPGIPEEDQRLALRSGGRLDASKPGTGLGLAIAVDLLTAYGADLELERSERLGGLAAKVVIPT